MPPTHTHSQLPWIAALALGLAPVSHAAKPHKPAASPSQPGPAAKENTAGTQAAQPAATLVYTPLDASGNPIPIHAETKLPVATPRCVRHNPTRLVWEVKTDDDGPQDKDWIYQWGSVTGGGACGQTLKDCNTDAYIAAINAMNPPLCGLSGWHLPSRIDFGSLVDRSSGIPVFPGVFFPNTVEADFWTHEYTPDRVFAWSILSPSGVIMAGFPASAHHVRLVTRAK